MRGGLQEQQAGVWDFQIQNEKVMLDNQLDIVIVKKACSYQTLQQRREEGTQEA